MNYWLMKSEPETFSWDDLQNKKRDHWDGVRNYQARNNLRSMRPGDLAFFYHSGGARQIVGIIEIVSQPFPDPTAQEGDWTVVDVMPKQRFKRPVTLKEIKEDPFLQEMVVVKNTRLSVQPVTKEQFDYIISLTELP